MTPIGSISQDESVCKCVGVFISEGEYVCIYVFIYVCIILKICDKISSTYASSKQLYMTCGYITINKTNKRIFRVVGGRT